MESSVKSDYYLGFYFLFKRAPVARSDRRYDVRTLEADRPHCAQTLLPSSGRPMTQMQRADRSRRRLQDPRWSGLFFVFMDPAPLAPRQPTDLALVGSLRSRRHPTGVVSLRETPPPPFPPLLLPLLESLGLSESNSARQPFISPLLLFFLRVPVPRCVPRIANPSQRR